MLLAILLTGHAYLPEAWAYADYLERNGVKVRLTGRAEEAAGCDLAIVFTLRHQWAMRRLGVPAVHEYHSLSTGRVPWLKDLIKRHAAPPAVARIFSETHIAGRLDFAAAVPSVMRPMGIDAALFGCATASAPDHDLVYCGSIERVGVLATIARLAGLGWRTLVVGSPPQGADLSSFAALPVTFAGPLARGDIPAALARARFGLNVTPDVFPYNRQTSIKTLEYAAAGLGIIANRYGWIEGFAREHGAPVQWLDEVLAMGPDAAARLERPRFDPARLEPLEWGRMLDRIGFADFLRAAAGAGGSSQR